MINKKEVLKASQNSIGSSELHTIDSFLPELRNYTRHSEFPIKEQYFEDKIVITAVNVNTLFSYWEITEELLLKFGLNPYSFNGEIKICESERDIFSAKIDNRIGKYYAKIYAPAKRIYCKIGFYDKDNNFVELIRSKEIKTPSDLITETVDKDEVWMIRSEEWLEVIRASTHFSIAVSSKSFLKEMELLKKFQISEMIGSSQNSIKGN